MRHVRTDPACSQHRHPRGKLSTWWFDRHRGRLCPPCRAERTLARIDAEVLAEMDALPKRRLHLHEPMGGFCRYRTCPGLYEPVEFATPPGHDHDWVDVSRLEDKDRHEMCVVVGCNEERTVPR